MTRIEPIFCGGVVGGKGSDTVMKASPNKRRHDLTMRTIIRAKSKTSWDRGLTAAFWLSEEPADSL
jgi:hypothetical protein